MVWHTLCAAIPTSDRWRRRRRIILCWPNDFDIELSWVKANWASTPSDHQTKAHEFSVLWMFSRVKFATFSQFWALNQISSGKRNSSHFIWLLRWVSFSYFIVWNVKILSRKFRIFNERFNFLFVLSFQCVVFAGFYCCYNFMRCFFQMFFSFQMFCFLQMFLWWVLITFERKREKNRLHQ